MSSYIRTDTVLDQILAHKEEEVAAAQARLSLAEVERRATEAAPPRDFLAALRRDTVALIA
ncbi:MAG: indole-3-glycerol-phosphate synthase TrpC, partial [Anaerolineae bacterium]|nr:indole-3-glycerol-phosphate synthase TrpC [Anaerolineae bacterium]